MNTQFEFVTATSNDVNTIAALHTLSWQQHYQGLISADYLTHQLARDRVKLWQARLNNTHAQYWVLLAKQGEQLVGFVCLHLVPTQDGILLDNLHVLKQYQGCGLGKALFSYAAGYVHRHLPNNALYLEVLSKNAQAITFYERLNGQFMRLGWWQTPCGNQVEERIYCWHQDQLQHLIYLA